ncbi:hypothetical protein J25TS5_37570 [Paenibacillus faecis]|uniref:alpha/beta hydrolase n=1 Tax=Paenibacillus faecis TaxID=862114 RepID=UPI001B216CFD|nr:alpha/beta hydrolase [Paenibacillus faecis]GIO86825.1 hypothetical protein J25TS5_37570 [Paenibacillus faecis]
MTPKWKKGVKYAVTGLAAVLLAAGGGFWIYAQDYYRADAAARQVLAEPQGKVEALEKMWVFRPDPEQTGRERDGGSPGSPGSSRNLGNPRSSESPSSLESPGSPGLIFYPGGKVEAAAYAPLLQKLAQHGITCVLMEMPFNLAVLDANAADRAFAQLPQVKRWYIGGHSLGGAMAGSYAGAHADKLEGLILLGAYSAAALPEDLPTLAIYGSEDRVLDRSKLPVSPNTLLEIAGGNHAYFGDYGEQKGDGTAAISREEQQRQTAEAIVKFMTDDHER